MGDFPFFYTGTLDEVVECSIDLALTFHCDPMVFLSKQSEQVFTLFTLVQKFLEKREREK
jgi:hypothetical protein